MLRFRCIDLNKDRETIISFRKDSYVVSFGNIDGFGDEKAYLKRIQERLSRFPDGLMLVEDKGKTVGQIELQTMFYDEQEIGYVNLYYLIPEYRGKGYGKYLMEYAEQFFRSYGVKKYHLRVAPTNERAINFYTKFGLKKLKDEQLDYLVCRMYKEI